MVRFWLASALRLSFAAFLMFSSIALGWGHSDPWAILPLAGAFTVLFVLGKLSAFRVTYRQKGLRGVCWSVVLTAPVQAVLAGLLFALGVGLARLWGVDAEFASAMSQQDWKSIGLLLVTGAVASCLVDLLERGKGSAGLLADEVAEKARQLAQDGG